jgi:hypothetical protein
MFRILLILGLAYTGNVLAADSDNDIERYRAYFKNLGLPYEEPRGCGANAPCSVAGDFNDDGVEDLAALYQYSGDKSRRAGWNLDLVIVYSNEGSSELTHVLFTHVGQVNAKSDETFSLAIQSKGLMKVPRGEITLARPGINVFFGRNTEADQYQTFYWYGDGFDAIDKSDD